MDFLRNRMFRESLLCKDNITPSWSVQPQSVRLLHVASSARPVPPEGQQTANLTDESPVAFRSPSGMSMTTGRPLLKCAMAVLQEVYPATLPFDVVRRVARERFGGLDPNNTKQAAEDSNMIAVGLLQLYISSDLIELHGMPLTFNRKVNPKPVALPMARLMAAKTGVISNRRHEVVRLGELDRHLIPMLDGTNDKAKILDKLTEVAKTGQITVRKEEMTLTEPAEIRAALESVIDQALANVARMAVLVG
jgi:methyltransferase-like protein